MLVISVLVWSNLGFPILFKQIRPGLHGKPFTILKFRTMKLAVDQHGKPLPDEKRLTKFGQFLRSTSLDELPELWNVVVGTMSLVGPRPLLTEYLSRYTAEQNRRHDLRPGITGYAQVNGRNSISWDKVFELDLWYVDHCSLWLDINILLRTLSKVVLRSGINEKGEATRSIFMGSVTDKSASKTH